MPILKTAYHRYLEDPEEFCTSEYQTDITLPLETEWEIIPVTPVRGKRGFWKLLLENLRKGR